MSSYGFTLNRDQVINGALRVIGVLAEGETPSTAQVSNAAEALNLLILQWETRGLPLWAISKQVVTLVAGQNKYDFGISNNIKNFEVTNMLMHNLVANSDITMQTMSRSDYLRLGNKDANGTPVQYYHELQKDYASVYVYPTPDLTVSQNYEIHIWYQKPFQTMDASTDIPDFPNEFLNALKWNLAVALAPEYGIIDSKLDRLIKMADNVADEAFDFNVEHTSINFQPDRWSTTFRRV